MLKKYNLLWTLTVALGLTSIGFAAQSQQQVSLGDEPSCKKHCHEKLNHCFNVCDKKYNNGDPRQQNCHLNCFDQEDECDAKCKVGSEINRSN